MANFITELSGFPQEVTATPVKKPWQIFIDGSSCRVRGGIGVHIIDKAGREYHYMAKFMFMTTDNEPEYEALTVGLSVVKALRATKVEIKENS